MPPRRDNGVAHHPTGQPSPVSIGKKPMAYAPPPTAAATPPASNPPNSKRPQAPPGKATPQSKRKGTGHNAGAAPAGGGGGTGGGGAKIWSTSSSEERERIKDFWLGLGEQERRNLVKIEKDTVLRKMKEQQKHSCSCAVCGRKRCVRASLQRICCWLTRQWLQECY